MLPTANEGRSVSIVRSHSGNERMLIDSNIGEPVLLREEAEKHVHRFFIQPPDHPSPVVYIYSEQYEKPKPEFHDGIL